MKQIILVSLFTATTLALFGQHRGHRGGGERIEARKIAYLTDVLELTPEEAQVFWPKYNEYRKVHDVLRAASKSQDDDVAEADLQAHFEREEKILELKKSFILEAEKILGSSRALKLLRADRKFKERILEGYKKRHGKGK